MTTVNLNEVRGQLINYEVYQGSTRLLGHATVDLPEFKYKTVTLNGAGISGDLDMPTLGHTEALTITLNWRSIHSDLTALTMHKAIDLTMYGAYQLYNSSDGKMSVQSVKIDTRVIPKSTTFGKFEPAATSDSKNELEIVTIKIKVGNDEVLDYDKLNNVFVVNGTDYYKDVRTALGRSN